MNIRKESGGYYELKIDCRAEYATSECIREYGHPGKHLNLNGKYWGGLPIPWRMRTKTYWQGFMLGTLTAFLGVWVIPFIRSDED